MFHKVNGLATRNIQRIRFLPEKCENREEISRRSSVVACWPSIVGGWSFLAGGHRSWLVSAVGISVSAPVGGGSVPEGRLIVARRFQRQVNGTDDARPVGKAETARRSRGHFRRASRHATVLSGYPPLKWRATIGGPSGTLRPGNLRLWTFRTWDKQRRNRRP